MFYIRLYLSADLKDLDSQIMFHCNLITIVNALASNRDKTSLPTFLCEKTGNNLVLITLGCSQALAHKKLGCF